MNILFTADVHVNKKRLPDVLSFFDLCKTIIKEKKVDLFVIGGDLWNAMIPNTKGSGFVDILTKLKELKELCEISIIYGTPSHEPNGSLDFASAFGINVYKTASVEAREDGNLLYIPEPRRSDFIAEDSKTISKNINDYLFNTCMQNSCDVIFYHGEIANAHMDNGVACNSDYKLSESMITVSNAKLVLAGHIHTPQEPIPNVHYVGSPIPCSFGETHSGTVIYFSLNNHEISNFERIATGAPTYRSLELDNPEKLRDLAEGTFKNTHLKIKVPLTEGEKLSFNLREATEYLKEKTGAISVNLNVYTTKETSVRTKEIAKATSIIDKLKIFSEVNNMKISDSILEKARAFEDSLLINYAFPSKSLELISLDLRGAKGIKSKEEIHIDFSKYEDGLVALTGENGCGKTTLLEMASPFPCLLTRSGALKNHFYLKDSHKIVIFKDENNKYYKFTIQLAAHIDSGLVKYFVETSDDGEVWKSVPECTGNLQDYQDYVEGLFGNVSLYLRTAFFTKGKTKGTPDIASASKGERITLLSQLLGTENLIALHDMAKDKMRELKEELSKYIDIEDKYAQYKEIIDEKQAEKDVIEQKISDVESQLDLLHKKIPELEEELAEYNARFSNINSTGDIKAEYENQVEKAQEVLDDLLEKKRLNEIYLTKTVDINNYIELKTGLDKLTKDANKAFEKMGKKNSEYATLQDQYLKDESQLNAEQLKIDRINGKIEIARTTLTPISDICPTCGAYLSPRKKAELFKEQETKSEEIKALEDARNTLQDNYKTLEHELKLLNTKVRNAEKSFQEATELSNSLTEELSATKIQLDNNKEYDNFIGYVALDALTLQENIETANKDLVRAKDLLLAFESEDYINLNEEYNTALEEEKSLTNTRVQYLVEEGKIVGSLEINLENLESLKAGKERAVTLTKEYDEYSVLEKAFSNSGIQALELEAAAPSIADLTNQILKESYGDKFTVSFSTLRQGRSKLVDDFAINVTNNETGWTTPIELLSEGEKIWIMQSLYYAFSLIRMEKTGFSFKVRFVDESDGALDSDMRLKYVKMIESAHKAGNARLTVMITHSQEVKDIVSQVVSLS